MENNEKFNVDKDFFLNVIKRQDTQAKEIKLLVLSIDNLASSFKFFLNGQNATQTQKQTYEITGVITKQENFQLLIEELKPILLKYEVNSLNVIKN